MTSITRNVYVDGQKIAVAAANPSAATSARTVHTGGVPAITSASGTDTTPVITETYLAEIYVHGLTTTGVAVFNGSVASGNITVAIYGADGISLGASASTAMSGTDAYQRVPLVVTLLPGPYWVALQVDNTTARFNTHVSGNFGAGKITSTVYGTLGSVTVPTTFTTGLGPIASLY